MKTGSIIALIGIGTGVVGAGIYGYKKLVAPKATTTTGLIPAGTNPQTGLQQYADKAGNVVDSAGTLIASAQNAAGTILSVLNPSKAGSEYEGKLIRVNKGPVYLVKSGLLRYISKLPLIDGRGWDQVQEVKSNPSGLQMGTDLNLQTLSGFTPAKVVSSRLLNGFSLVN